MSLTADNLGEGSPCPECGEELAWKAEGSCSCHISAPCSSCTDQVLACPACGWERESDKWTYRHIGGGISEVVPVRRPFKDLGDGRAIFDWDYDSSSGSTMVFKGKFSGKVTAEDIIDYFGDGTFGHRGPFLDASGTFTYTKITD